jgi:membrane associated rhomboid family serine protease
MSMIDKILANFKNRSSHTRLLLINIALFLLVKIFALIIFLFKLNTGPDLNPLHYLALPANLEAIGSQPWTLFTYMFYHEEVFHILFNMLCFYWFGKIFVNYIGAKRLTLVYILGGLFGAAFYIGAFNVFPAFEEIRFAALALGASASVMAVAVAIAFYVPDMEVTLFLFGRLKLKYIILAYVALDVLSIASENSGGHIAHLGGAFFGMLYTLQMKHGKDLLRNLQKSFRPKPRMKATKGSASKMDDMDYNYRKAKEQAEIDKILDKIAKSGYDSLSKEEKNTLFNSSRK